MQRMGGTNNLPESAVVPSRRHLILGAVGVFGGLTLGPVKNWARADETSTACEVIHQEVAFKVSCKQVYEALTDAKQFNKVVMLSAAMQSGMAPGGKPVEVSSEAGGAFFAFWRLHYGAVGRTCTQRKNCPSVARGELGAWAILYCEIPANRARLRDEACL
jgi:hypothetical protein